jgi:hypothetical protein
VRTAVSMTEQKACLSEDRRNYGYVTCFRQQQCLAWSWLRSQSGTTSKGARLWSQVNIVAINGSSVGGSIESARGIVGAHTCVRGLSRGAATARRMKLYECRHGIVKEVGKRRMTCLPRWIGMRFLSFGAGQTPNGSAGEDQYRWAPEGQR